MNLSNNLFLTKEGITIILACYSVCLLVFLIRSVYWGFKATYYDFIEYVFSSDEMFIPYLTSCLFYSITFILLVGIFIEIFSRII